MRTKILILISVMLLNMTYSFAQNIEVDGIYYKLNFNNRTAEVAENNYQYSGDINIPSIIAYDNVNYYVTSIGYQAFAFCAITSINVSEGLINICDRAFESCDILTSVIIPNSVVNIGYMAFVGCRILHSFVIPNGVGIIEEEVFFSCRTLESIVIPSSVVNIKDGIFYSCYELNTIVNLNPMPVDISFFQYIFHNVNIAECTLTVPTSAVTAYQNAAIWKDFNIVGGGILVNPTVNNNLWGYTDGNALYSSGETATVTATARYSCNFVNWTVNGEIVSTEETYSFTVTDDIELVANFEQHTNNVNVTINNPDYGTVTGAGSYPLNSTATLKAHPESDFKFVNWTKDGAGIYNNPYSFIVVEDVEIYANFREKYNYIVSLDTNNPEYGAVQGAGTYLEDEWAYLSATANQGYHFAYWTINGAIVSSEQYYSFLVMEDTKLLAVFIVNDWGIEDIEKVDIIVYPNPTNGKLTINNEQLEIKEIEVFSLMGKKQNVIFDNQLVKYVLDISHLPAGIYIVRITTEEDIIVKKILKM